MNNKNKKKKIICQARSCNKHNSQTVTTTLTTVAATARIVLEERIIALQISLNILEIIREIHKQHRIIIIIIQIILTPR